MSEAIQVVTTAADKAQAERIARALVERRLAACVQIAGPVTSVYRWQQKIETAQEWTCTIKTLRGLFPQVEAAIAELHSYEVPEILAVAVTLGSRRYLAWLEAECTNSTSPSTPEDPT